MASSDENGYPNINRRKNFSSCMCALFLPVALLSTGCAGTPNVTYRYYPALSKTTAKVTQTVACNSTKTEMVILNDAEISTQYASDLSVLYSLDITKLDSAFADTDVKAEFFDDGRLKSLNSTSTGEGETILKSGITLATAIIPLLPTRVGDMHNALPICDDINSWNASMPVTLIYAGDIDLTTNQTQLIVSKGPIPLAEKLDAFPKVVVISRQENMSGVSYSVPSNGRPEDVAWLKLRSTRNVTFEVHVKDQRVSADTIVVPVPNSQPYELPIPKAKLFGNETFALTLSEAGAVTAVEYGKATGAAGLLNVVGAAATAAAPQTAAEKAAETQAQADLIAQQQRLAQCLLDHTNCK